MSEETGHLCDVENSALIIIDIQTHLTAVMPAKVLARLQRNLGLLLNAARLLDVPVLATEQYPQGLGNLEEDIVRMLPESAGRYEKTSFACTGSEDFSRDLQASGKKQVIIAGMEAHVCVIQTALELKTQGYQVFVVADAICSRHRESYETALLRLRAANISILDAESVAFEWVRDSKHEHFKAVQSALR